MAGALVARVDLDRLTSGPLQKLRDIIVDLGGQLYKDLTCLPIDDLFGEDASDDLLHSLRVDRARIHTLRLKEDLVDLRVRAVAKRPQEGRGGELLLLVDVDVTHIIDVDGELDPGASEGNNAGAVQLRSVGMYALLKHDTGGTV